MVQVAEVKPEGAQAGAFISIVDERLQSIWDAIYSMPFVVELGKGTLDQKAFAYFIAEDRLYLDRFSKALALGSVHSHDHDVRHFFLERSGAAMGSEDGFHTGWGGRLGIDIHILRKQEPGPITLAYTDHMLRVAQVGPLPDLVAVVLPCYLVYKRVGQRLATNPPDHEMYRTWITNYARDDFAARVDRQCALADRLYLASDDQTRERMVLWFTRSLRYEYLFWDQAYTGRNWPTEVAPGPLVVSG
jgi:thiaminase/transcriptional activator TenA